MEIRFEDTGEPPASNFDAGSVPSAGSSPDPVPCRLLLEEARVRADEAEARCRDLRCQEVEARSRAHGLKALLERSRSKPEAARAEVREIRRTAKGALALEQEVARLNRLPGEAGIDARKRSTIQSLRRENGALKAEVRGLRERVAALEARIGEPGSSRSSMSRSAYGRKSEKASSPSSQRQRGQQSGASCHGRTPRPRLEKVEERRDPPEDERTCSRCGELHVANGSRESEIIDIQQFPLNAKQANPGVSGD